MCEVRPFWILFSILVIFHPRACVLFHLLRAVLFSFKTSEYWLATCIIGKKYNSGVLVCAEVQLYLLRKGSNFNNYLSIVTELQRCLHNSIPQRHYPGYIWSTKAYHSNDGILSDSLSDSLSFCSLLLCPIDSSILQKQLDESWYPICSVLFMVAGWHTNWTNVAYSS